MANETLTLLELINQTGGIPLIIETTTKTNSFQFSITVLISLIGSFFIFYMIWGVYKADALTFVARARLRKIKKITGKNIVLIKHTKQEMFSVGMIDRTTVSQIIKAMQKFKGEAFDLVLHTPGGEIFSSQFISRLLKQYPGKIRVFIPQFAMSGGTLLALSCDEFYMNNISCMGPIDPQLGNLFKFGSSNAWNKIVKMKKNRAEDSSISFALMGEQYTKSMHKHLIGLLDGKLSVPKSRKLARFLTDGAVEHGYNLLPSQLMAYGLDIKEINHETNLLLNKIINSPACEGVHFT